MKHLLLRRSHICEVIRIIHILVLITVPLATMAQSAVESIRLSSQSPSLNSLKNQALLTSSLKGWSWSLTTRSILLPSWNIQSGTLRYDLDRTSFALGVVHSGRREWSQTSSTLSFAHQIHPDFRLGLRFNTNLNSFSESSSRPLSLDGFGKYSFNSWTCLVSVNRIWQRLASSLNPRWMSAQITIERVINDRHLINMYANGSSEHTTVLGFTYGYYKDFYLVSCAIDLNGAVHFSFGWTSTLLQIELGFSFHPSLLFQPEISVGHVQTD